MTARPALPLTPLEAVSGLVLGHDPARAGLPAIGPGLTPRAALERAILPALRRPPCLVSFSGGRDSSAVLALAAHVARREGLAAPVPATHRFPQAGGTQESEWQEQVVAFLGLDDWIRLDAADELDCVGPVARRALARHGLLWPCNAHFHLPLLELASGGSLLTGIGGDEVLGGSSWARVTDVLGARVRPEPRDLLRLANASAPARVRARRLHARYHAATGVWLTPAARSAVAASLARSAASEPIRWARRFGWWRSQRYLEVGLANLALLAADAGASIHHPLADDRFFAALAALPRSRRFRTRSEAMELLVGDLLPPASLTRATKARFDEVFWSRHSRELAARWRGEGVDHALVNAEALRRVWASEDPDPRSFTLLQAAALALDMEPARPVVSAAAG